MTKTITINKLGIFLLIPFFFYSCFDYQHIEEDTFLGIWELKGRSLYTGMQVDFVRENNKLIGRIHSIPKNKYAQFFPDTESIWINNIDRASNYSFKIQEKKVGSNLFSIYGLETTSTFYVLFSENKDTLFLMDKNPNPSATSTIYYKRIK